MHVLAEERLQELDGMIAPDVIVDLASPVTGVVAAVMVERTDSVRAGDVVAQLDDAVQRAQLKLAQTRAQSSGEIRAREAAKSFADQRSARTGELYRKNVLPLDNRDEAQAQARVAGEDLHTAREKRDIAVVETSVAQQLLEQRVIRSPIDGIVLERLVQPGAHVEEQPLLRIARLNPLRVEVIVPLDYFDAIKPGMQAQIVPELPMPGDFMASVTRVDKVVDPASGTFTVQMSLPNPGNKLPSGLKCKVLFKGGLAKIYTPQDVLAPTATAPVTIPKPAALHSAETAQLESKPLPPANPHIESAEPAPAAKAKQAAHQKPYEHHDLVPKVALRNPSRWDLLSVYLRHAYHDLQQALTRTSLAAVN